MTKKDVKKNKSPDMDIKVRNFGKIIKNEQKKDKNKCCSFHSKMPCGNCWIFGSALAMILSYTQNTSILWAILHGALSWFYILFKAIQIWGWI